MPRAALHTILYPTCPFSSPASRPPKRTAPSAPRTPALRLENPGMGWVSVLLQQHPDQLRFASETVRYGRRVPRRD